MTKQQQHCDRYRNFCDSIWQQRGDIGLNSEYKGKLGVYSKGQSGLAGRWGSGSDAGGVCVSGKLLVELGNSLLTGLLLKAGQSDQVSCGGRGI